MKVILFSLLLLLIAARDYPLYNQCDSKWAKEKMGTSTHTICDAGDIISAVAMGMTAIGKTETPSTLNTWLKSNKGYDSKNQFVWNSVNALGITYQGLVPIALLKLNLDVGYLVIINVDKGAHWVLATGYTGNTIHVRDSLHTTITNYDTSQIVTGHIAIYKVPTSLPTELLYKLEEIFKISGKDMNENNISSE